MPDPIKKILVKKEVSAETNTVEQDSVKKKVMVKISPQEKRAEMEKQAQIKRDDIVRKKDSIINRNLNATGLTREQYRAKQIADAKKPDAQLDGLNTADCNKRGEKKGSCSTGATMGGDSLKDTK